MKWYEAGATYVAMWTTIIGGGAALLVGYAIEFGLVNFSPSKAFFLGAVIVWLSVLCTMFFAVGLSSTATREQ